MNRIIILLLIMAGFFSCQKKNNTDPGPSQVSFNITSPVAGQVYHNGDSVRVRATISFPSEMHGYEVKITDTATGNVVYDNAEHVHNDHFDVTGGYVAGGATALPALKMELMAEIDHNGTIATKTVTFQYQP